MALPVSALAATAFAVGETIALRPGLHVPDWSLLSDPQGRAALAASMEVAGRREKWAGLSATEDTVRRAVLRYFAEYGTGPTTREAGTAVDCGHAEALDHLRSLDCRDLLTLDGEGTRVASAYPFSGAPTTHRVALGGPVAVTVHALCAIDALGMGAMLGVDTEIEAQCAQCGRSVAVRICDGGRTLRHVTPSEAVVWSGTHYAGGCAATSGCALKPFFCSEAHREAWRQTVNSEVPGFRLTMAAALQVGSALFAPMLGN